MRDRNAQVGGSHYRSMKIQPLEVMEVYFSPEEYRGYLWGNVVKYTLRWKLKGGIEDLKKAQHYLSELLGVLEKQDGGKSKGRKAVALRQRRSKNRRGHQRRENRDGTGRVWYTVISDKPPKARSKNRSRRRG